MMAPWSLVGVHDEAGRSSWGCVLVHVTLDLPILYYR